MFADFTKSAREQILAYFRHLPVVTTRFSSLYFEPLVGEYIMNEVKQFLVILFALITLQSVVKAVTRELESHSSRDGLWECRSNVN